MPYPKKGRYYALLGHPPTEIDADKARSYHVEIMALLDVAGPPDVPCPACADRFGGQDAADYGGLCEHCNGMGDLPQPPWTRSERAGLQRLEKRWRRRALGYDKRWLVAGLKIGRLPRETEDAIAPRKRRPDPAWTDSE